MSPLRCALALLALVHCAPAAEPSAAAGPRVRVVHAAPGAPALDVALDGLRLARGLGYGEATDSEEVLPGMHALKVLDAQGGGAFAAQPLDLPAGRAVTLVLTVREGRLEVHALADGFAVAREGHIRVRLLHAAPLKALAVDLDNDGVVEAALEPGEATAPEGFELKANATTALRLTGAGRFTVPALPSDSELLLVLTGTPAPPENPKQALALLGLAPSAVLGFISPETGVQ